MHKILILLFLALLCHVFPGFPGLRSAPKVEIDDKAYILTEVLLVGQKKYFHKSSNTFSILPRSSVSIYATTPQQVITTREDDPTNPDETLF